MILLILVFFLVINNRAERTMTQNSQEEKKLGNIENCALHNHIHNIVSIDYSTRT